MGSREPQILIDKQVMGEDALFHIHQLLAFRGMSFSLSPFPGKCGQAEPSYPAYAGPKQWSVIPECPLGSSVLQCKTGAVHVNSHTQCRTRENQACPLSRSVYWGGWQEDNGSVGCRNGSGSADMPAMQVPRLIALYYVRSKHGNGPKRTRAAILLCIPDLWLIILASAACHTGYRHMRYLFLSSCWVWLLNSRRLCLASGKMAAATEIFLFSKSKGACSGAFFYD